MENKCSLIIPTYNRASLLQLTLKSLSNLNEINLIREVIICDSYSSDNTPEVINIASIELPQINFLHLHTKNNISQKRNLGIKRASSEFLLFFDDDCELHKECVEKHINFLNSHKNNIVSGRVVFPKHQLQTSNYIRYRDSRHRYADFLSESENQLDYKQIVTMNMSARKSELLDNELFFDETFLSYGMEDNDFGYRAQEKGFSLGFAKGTITHHDRHTFLTFKKKIFSSARDGTYNFLQKSPQAVWEFYYSIYLEQNYPHKSKLSQFKSKLFRFLLFRSLATLLTRFVLLTDKYKFLYFEIFYRYILATEYLKGTHQREKRFISQEEIDGGFFD
ncbi:glycosyltransferase [Gammaproteobacteria bacterium]|nr:glycosyltransferase [Gammaproteobacteria bacterium]